MKVAIIGATGQLGTELSNTFVNPIKITHDELDVTDFERSHKFLKEHKPDVIINTAAFHQVDKCEEEPLKAFLINALGACNIARIANELNAINVFMSTDYVFDGKKNDLYTENDIPNPINVYGVSKYAGELFTANYSPKSYVVRLSGLFGKAGSRGKGGNFIDTMITKAKNKEAIEIINDITMSPTYAKDAAKIIKTLLERKPSFGTYHVVNEGTCSWYELAIKIFEYIGLDVKVTPTKSVNWKRPANRPIFSALDNLKLHELKIKMPVWEDALKRYLIEKGHIGE
jgi:dTDP-4-dehydrorhamnose reductase